MHEDECSLSQGKKKSNRYRRWYVKKRRYICLIYSIYGMGTGNWELPVTGDERERVEQSPESAGNWQGKSFFEPGLGGGHVSESDAAEFTDHRCM